MVTCALRRTSDGEYRTRYGDRTGDESFGDNSAALDVTLRLTTAPVCTMRWRVRGDVVQGGAP